MKRPPARRPGLATRHGLPLLLYLTLALLMTWPLALQFGTAVPGSGYDSWQNMWNFWWLRQALLHGYNPYFTPYLYYPHGASLLLHTLNPINFIISLPVHALFGLVAAYNFVVLFSLTMSGYTALLLARDLLASGEPGTENRELGTMSDERGSSLIAHRSSFIVGSASLVAGVIFAFSGYLLAQVMGGHTHTMAAWPIPLAVLALRQAARSAAAGPGLAAAPVAGRIALAGTLMALTLLSDWQYLLFTLIWGGWYALWLLVEGRKETEGTATKQFLVFRLPRSALAVVAATALAVILTLPLLISTALFAVQTPTAETEGGANFRLEHSLDLADFLIPSQLHPIWGRLAEQLQAYKAETHIQNKTAYLGLVTLVLAALGLRSKGGRFWLLSAIIFGLLAMGPQLQFFGIITSIPLPGALIFELPLVRIFRYPVRFAVITILALAMLAALGTQRLLVLRLSRASAIRNTLLTIALSALITIDNLTMPFPMVGVYIPSIYAELGRDQEEYAILEAPFYFRTSPVYMLYQAVHGKPLVGGYISRSLPYPLVEQIPTVRMFAYAQPAPDIIADEPGEVAASIFSYFNIRYLTLHSAGGALRYNTLLRVAQAAAGGAPPLEQESSLVYSDARSASGLRRSFGKLEEAPAGAVLVYRVAPPAEPRPFLGVGRGWSAPLAQTDRSVARQIRDEAEVLIYSAVPRTVTLELELHSSGAGRLGLMVAGRSLSPLEVSSGPQQLKAPLEIGAGVTSVLLKPDGMGDVTVQRVGLVVSGAGAERRLQRHVAGAPERL